MTLQREWKRRQRVLMLGAAIVSSPIWLSSVRAQEKIFETNVTNDLTISSGEPEIGVDPKNPRHLAIIEFSVGTTKHPAYSFSPYDFKKMAEDFEGYTGNVGRIMVSTDGGNHWTAKPPPVYGLMGGTRIGGGDPYLVYGPKGDLYVGAEVGTPPPDMGNDISHLLEYSNVGLAVSSDGGNTFSKSQYAGTPIDRPWITVDPSTGTVYTASTGPLNLKTGAHNVPSADAPHDRWLVAWKPGLTGKSEPRRLGGPDFSAAGGSTVTAAHGVVAATFVLGTPEPGAGAKDGPPTPKPVPASLHDLMKDGIVSCSLDAPCLFFETSTDEGQHWTRHHVATPGGFFVHRAGVAADPGRPGRYAIEVLNLERTKFLVFVTNDSGATWSTPVSIPETATGVNFKEWVAYGPSGVLGVVWKKRRVDLTPAEVTAKPEVEGVRVTEAAFDVYAALSCDGGLNWHPAVRMNAETSPSGAPGEDDLSYIVLDKSYAHMVWGDRRLQPKITNVPGAMGGVQAFYGRLPFSVVSNGTSCGRK